MKKEDYIKGINTMMEQCNDIPLMDLIYKLLYKSLSMETRGITQ